MSREKLTDEEIELEIARLKASPYVKLARKEQRLKYNQKKRQEYYSLLYLERKGKALEDAGITEDIIETFYKNDPNDF